MVKKQDAEEAIRLAEERSVPMSESQKEWFRLAMADEELHPDLAECMEENETFGMVLKHPLVFQVGYGMPALANKMYEHKKERLAEAFQTQNWNTYVYLHERPYRMQAFQELIELDVLSDIEYWSLAGDIWTDSENIHEWASEWQMVLSSDRSSQGAMMSGADLYKFTRFPDRLEVYRGCIHDLNEEGMSWTLDRRTAEWFARRFAVVHDGQALVLHGEVDKDDVVGYFHEAHRNEDEIVVADPDKVRLRGVEEV
jgi:hypothetical protein